MAFLMFVSAQQFPRVSENSWCVKKLTLKKSERRPKTFVLDNLLTVLRQIYFIIVPAWLDYSGRCVLRASTWFTHPIWQKTG